MWFPGCSDVASGSGQKKMKHIWNKGIIVQAAGEGFNPSYLGWRFLLWFSSEWESRFYKLPVSAEELELHRWFPHEKWRFIKLSYSPKKKKKKKQFENPVIISTFLLLRKFLEVSRCHHKFICIRSLSTGVTALKGDKGGGRELL